jgi:hypothetical protein
MPVSNAVVLTMSNKHAGVLVVDAAYFRKRARQCLRLVCQTHVASAAVTLCRLAEPFEANARSLQSDGERRAR